MKRCLQCNAPSFGEYCTPGCVAAAETLQLLKRGDVFTEEERRAVEQLAKEMERT